MVIADILDLRVIVVFLDSADWVTVVQQESADLLATVEHPSWDQVVKAGIREHQHLVIVVLLDLMEHLDIQATVAIAVGQAVTDSPVILAILAGQATPAILAEPQRPSPSVP